VDHEHDAGLVRALGVDDPGVQPRPVCHLDVDPLAVEHDRVAGFVQGLHVNVGHVPGHHGRSPGHVLVVADEHARNPGERDPDDASQHFVPALVPVVSGIHLRVVEERRVHEHEVRVVEHQGVAALGVLAGDDPVIGSPVLAREELGL